jgi:putative RNA 2'-phosphotransferase
MEKDRHTKISKALSYWLRHRPEKIGITLDEDGWTDITTLIENAKEEIEFTFEELQEVVANCDKQRFSLSEDLKNIRASQGHSVKIDMKFEEITAPPILYHGTVAQFLESIKKKGLLPMNRHHVHLSSDIETAKKVGARRGKPVILEIDAKTMQDLGFKFFISDNGVYLTDSVPKRYIKFN